jgi:lactoylglutathione lyase
MEYLHTMIRVHNLESTLDFFINKLEMVETNRIENEAGRFTLIFLAAKNDVIAAKENKTPLVELTYNWPDKNGQVEMYTSGRTFGHLAYRVENIYKTCKKLMDKGVVINRPPRDGHMAFVKSPENISIELLQKGNSLEVQEPWASMKNVGTW